MLGLRSPSTQPARQPFGQQWPGRDRVAESNPSLLPGWQWLAVTIAPSSCCILFSPAGLLGFALVAASLDAAPLKATARTPGLSCDVSRALFCLLSCVLKVLVKAVARLDGASESKAEDTVTMLQTLDKAQFYV